jgi:hypothetical protein
MLFLTVQTEVGERCLGRHTLPVASTPELTRRLAMREMERVLDKAKALSVQGPMVTVKQVCGAGRPSIVARYEQGHEIHRLEVRDRTLTNESLLTWLLRKPCGRVRKRCIPPPRRS